MFACSAAETMRPGESPMPGLKDGPVRAEGEIARRNKREPHERACARHLQIREVVLEGGRLLVARRALVRLGVRLRLCLFRDARAREI